MCIPSLAAYEPYITSGGYKAVPNVEVNWNYIEQLSADTSKKIITKSKKKTVKKHNPSSPYIVTKTIIINSSTIKKESKQINYYKILVKYQVTGNYLRYMNFKESFAQMDKTVNFEKEEIKVMPEKKGFIIADGVLSVIRLP